MLKKIMRSEGSVSKYVTVNAAPVETQDHGRQLGGRGGSGAPVDNTPENQERNENRALGAGALTAGWAEALLTARRWTLGRVSAAQQRVLWD